MDSAVEERQKEERAESGGPVRYCTGCGSPLTPGAAFCENCGQPVETKKGLGLQGKLPSIGSIWKPRESRPAEMGRSYFLLDLVLGPDRIAERIADGRQRVDEGSAGMKIRDRQRLLWGLLLRVLVLLAFAVLMSSNLASRSSGDSPATGYELARMAVNLNFRSWEEWGMVLVVLAALSYLGILLFSLIRRKTFFQRSLPLLWWIGLIAIGTVVFYSGTESYAIEKMGYASILILWILTFSFLWGSVLELESGNRRVRKNIRWVLSYPETLILGAGHFLASRWLYLEGSVEDIEPFCVLPVCGVLCFLVTAVLMSEYRQLASRFCSVLYLILAAIDGIYYLLYRTLKESGGYFYRYYFSDGVDLDAGTHALLFLILALLSPGMFNWIKKKALGSGAK